MHPKHTDLLLNLLIKFHVLSHAQVQYLLSNRLKSSGFYSVLNTLIENKKIRKFTVSDIESKLYGIRPGVHEKIVGEPEHLSSFRFDELAHRLACNHVLLSLAQRSFVTRIILEHELISRKIDSPVLNRRPDGLFQYIRGDFKVPYYEHLWSTRRNACLVEKVFHCEPRRILASRIEPIVWAEVVKLMSNPKTVEILLEEARKVQHGRTYFQDRERLKSKIYGINSQIDALAERIAVLPKGLDPNPFYKQMEKLAQLKKEEASMLRRIELKETQSDEPSSLDSYQEFVKSMKTLSDSSDEIASEMKAKRSSIADPEN
jgi:DNA-binding ferritin-like protein